MDLHAAQIQGYFDIPLDHLHGGPILAEHFKKKNIQDLVVVSPDLGSVGRARTFAEQLMHLLQLLTSVDQKPTHQKL